MFDSNPPARGGHGWSRSRAGGVKPAACLLRPGDPPGSTLHPHVRLAFRSARRDPRRPQGQGPAVRGRHQQGHARDPPGAARGRRQLRRRQGLRRPRTGAGHGLRGDGQPHPRPAGRQDRARGADQPDGRGRHQALVLEPPAHGDPDGRPAGIRQDHRLRQAGPPAGQAEALARAGRLRRLPAGRHPAAADARQVAAGARLRAGHGRPGRDGCLGRRAGQGAGARRRDRRHRRPPAHRRSADGRAGAHQEGRQAAQRAAGARLDERPGRRHHRRGLLARRSTTTE